MSIAFIRLKLLGLCFITSSVFLIRDTRILIVLFCIVLALLWFYQRVLDLKTRILPLVLVSLCIIVFQIIARTDISFVSRVILGGVAALKVMILSLLVFLFTKTTSPSRLIQALSFLPRTLQFVLSMSLSLVPILLSEVAKIQQAQQSRGSKSLISILVPLLHRTLSRAEHIAIVLETRGYKG